MKTRNMLTLWPLSAPQKNDCALAPAPERGRDGEFFVVDNRIALDTRLQETETPEEAVFDAPQ